MSLTFENIDEFCRNVDVTGGTPVIDLGSITFVAPFALTYLGSFIRHHNRHGLFFEVARPTSNDVNTYLSNHHFWERFNIKGSDESTIGAVQKLTSFNDIIDIKKSPYIGENVGRMVYEVLSNGPIDVNVRLMEEITSELVDNFSQHSEADLATCAVQWYPNRGLFHLAIGDCGIGIRSSLATKEQFRYLTDRSHSDAASKAFESGVGRKAEGGMGLTDVRQMMPELKGQMFLSTGNAWVLINGPHGFRVGQQAYDLPGVQIELSIPTGG